MHKVHISGAKFRTFSETITAAPQKYTPDGKENTLPYLYPKIQPPKPVRLLVCGG